MKIEEAYLKFLEKVEKNYTNDNISADRGRFIYIFNEEQNKFVEWYLEKKSDDDIRYIQKLLVIDKKLKSGSKKINLQSFNLPENFFHFSDVQAFASKGDCKKKYIDLYEIKVENRGELLKDEFNKPSFKYRESFYFIGQDNINIFTDDFTIDDVYITYYRYPREVDIEGYIKEDGSYSKNIDPEFDDKVVDRILSACAKSFNVNNKDAQLYQVDRDRIFSKI